MLAMREFGTMVERQSARIGSATTSTKGAERSWIACGHGDGKSSSRDCRSQSHCRRWRRKQSCSSTRRSKPIRSRPTKRRSRKRIRTSTSNGCAIPPASSPRSSSRKKRTRKRTWSSASPHRVSRCSRTKGCCSLMRLKGSTRFRRNTAIRKIRRRGSAWTSTALRSASTPSKR